jgi:hypothetical protein
LNNYRQAGFTGSATTEGNFGLFVTMGNGYSVFRRQASKIGTGEVPLLNMEKIAFEGN